MFATILAVTLVCAFCAFIIYKATDDDTPSGGVGGIGVSTDRPKTQIK